MERLLDAFARVHRVAGEHRLDADRVGPAKADFAHLDLAGMAALIVVGIMTVGDRRHGRNSLESNGREGKLGARSLPATPTGLDRIAQGWRSNAYPGSMIGDPYPEGVEPIADLRQMQPFQGRRPAYPIPG